MTATAEDQRPGSRRRLVARVDAYQRDHRWLGLPLAVVYKFADDQGGYLAALVTYYGFVSLFPLLLLLVTALGYLLQGNPGLQHRLVHSALADFPIVGPQLEHNIHAYAGSGTAFAVGIVGTVYGGLGMTQAAQTVFNRIYGVPRNERPNPLTSRLRSLLLLLLLGVGVLLTTGLSALATGTQQYGAQLGTSLRLLAEVLAVLGNVGLFLAAFQLLTAQEVRLREVLYGGAIAALGWQVLQTVGTYYLSHTLKHSSEVYGVFGVVLGLIAWIYLEALVVVLCAELNVVWHRRLWPRALLTPFTDDVQLTDADEDAYASYARSERYKGFEHVDVSFDRRTGTDDG